MGMGVRAKIMTITKVLELATIGQLYEAASEIEAIYRLTVTPGEIRSVLEELRTILENGITLDSGDGFYYRLLAGKLVCHDGSVVDKGTLYDHLTKYVWQRKQLYELLCEVIAGGTTRQALEILGLSHSKRTYP